MITIQERKAKNGKTVYRVHVEGGLYYWIDDMWDAMIKAFQLNVDNYGSANWNNIHWTYSKAVAIPV